jgi:hypothetical protein
MTIPPRHPRPPGYKPGELPELQPRVLPELPLAAFIWRFGDDATGLVQFPATQSTLPPAELVSIGDAGPRGVINVSPEDASFLLEALEAFLLPELPPLPDGCADILEALRNRHPHPAFQVELEAETGLSRRTVGRRLRENLRPLRLTRLCRGKNQGEALTLTGYLHAKRFSAR